ncbi:MAG TPA: D-glycero-beta-D-manno-heptose 1-phosphate adenylyltransferase [Chitinophagaceae bacterium]|nr:D-glycero-beta-D-manno-heptose 1-phosphate adenylyltransferase [Chitinophagaceae bacterium]HNF71175.1 D-glycero-beta-D-manno-heptose 1-phosphate adenylyltransferase [Chitinophagaceae bacterium]
MASKLEIIQQKIYTRDPLHRLVNQWHMLSKKVVFTNGCFDLMHRGHNTYLLEAAELGNRLIVAINTDASVQRLKGPGRPVVDEYSRALNLAMHTYIDAVILFEEDTPLDLINLLKPDVLVKGGDYTMETTVGAKEVLERGGKVEIIPFLEGYSTTAMLERIHKNK